MKSRKVVKTLPIVSMSDTHEQHRSIPVPDGDILIHADDFTFFNRNADAVPDFNKWLGGSPHIHKVVIPGSHDCGMVQSKRRQQITATHFLINDGIELAGLRIWGAVVADQWRHIQYQFGQ